MPYVVITGNSRKAFETMREASESMDAQCRVYEQDAFGNMRPLSPEEAASIMSREPQLSQSARQAPTEPVEDARSASMESPVTIGQTPDEKRSLVNFAEMDKKVGVRLTDRKHESKDSYYLLKVLLIIVMIIIILIVGYATVKPFFSDLSVGMEAFS